MPDKNIPRFYTPNVQRGMLHRVEPGDLRWRHVYNNGLSIATTATCATSTDCLNHTFASFCLTECSDWTVHACRLSSSRIQDIPG